ncbi:hypothetical protein AB833_22010 [Chromatiales bacterium (ex Bugula neritina AB1)]|nr:hypothetical protein AB833_22010 [Chromatiales bacterium (ex Bugula neritina AB1)]
MNIEDYYTEEGEFIFFDRPQSSAFAKNFAGDFNPIHNIDARRFCVPGDLLFSVILHKYGLAEFMRFRFINMVDSHVRLGSSVSDGQITMCDTSGKEFMVVERSGQETRNVEITRLLVAAYVQFSGQTFPYLLVDLMRRTGLMINRARPLVFYKSMELKLDTLDVSDIRLQFVDSTMEPDGKKADVSLNFTILDGEKPIGNGAKKMVLGGLREFSQEEVSLLVSDYQEIKNTHVKAE